jgi:hypothetical protein
MAQSEIAEGGKGAVRATGHCLCGAIEIDIRGKLRDVVVCHCGQCRRQHGAPPSYTSAPWSNVTVRGEKNLRWYQSSVQARRGFCRLCGSSLFWEPVGEGRVAIAAGCLDKPTGLRTVRHIFVAEKADFDEITDGLEQLPHSMAAVTA